MALTPCDPCSCIPGEIQNVKFKQDVEIILCNILAAIEAGDITTENVNITGINGVTPSVGNGAAGTGVLRVTLASDSTGSVNVNNGAGAAAVNIQDGGNSITVDGTVVVSSITAALPAGTNAIGKLAANSGVDIGDVTIDNVAGTNPLPVQGNAAHDSAVAGNPVLIGGAAASTDITAVTAGDAARLLTTLLGKLVVQPYALPGRTTTVLIDNVAASGDLTVIAAPGAGSRIYITSLSLATVGANLITLRSGGGAIGYHFAQGASNPIPYSFPVPLRLGDDSAFIINVGTATGVTGMVTYYIATE